MKPSRPMLDVKDLNDWMGSLANNRPEWFREGRGYMATEIVEGEKYFMATNGSGNFFLNDAEFHAANGFLPRRDLFSALSQVAAGNHLSFNEEYAIESWWHEINHNRQKGLHSISHRKPDDIRKVVMETVNQFVSRHTYADFMREIGGQARHVDRVLADGYGYRGYLSRFNALLEALGIDPKDMVGVLQDYNFESLDMTRIVDEVGEAIARQATGKDKGVKTAGKDVARVLRALKKKEFLELAQQLKSKKWFRT